MARHTGHWAERAACAYLRRQGLMPLQRNYRCRFGELDLVMQDGATRVFVEVRYRRDSATAAESIDVVKRRRLWMTGAHYLQRMRLSSSVPCRFDAVLVSGPREHPRCEWLQAAFQYEDA